MLIQNMSLNPSARDRRNAVSALMPRLARTIALIRRGGTSIALAIRYCDIGLAITTERWACANRGLGSASAQDHRLGRRRGHDH